VLSRLAFIIPSTPLSEPKIVRPNKYFVDSKALIGFVLHFLCLSWSPPAALLKPDPSLCCQIYTIFSKQFQAALRGAHWGICRAGAPALPLWRAVATRVRRVAHTGAIKPQRIDFFSRRPRKCLCCHSERSEESMLLILRQCEMLRGVYPECGMKGILRCAQNDKRRACPE